MATMLDDFTTEEKSSVVCVFVVKRLSAVVHNEMFHVNGGKCLLQKAVHNWVANVSLMAKMLKRRHKSG
jgi:hypothetical protein